MITWEQDEISNYSTGTSRLSRQFSTWCLFRFVDSFFVFLCEHPLKYFFNPLGRAELITWKKSVLAVCWKYKRGMNIVATPFLLGGGWNSYQIFKKGGGLTGPLFLEVGWWERGTWSFRGGRGLQFLHKR